MESRGLSNGVELGRVEVASQRVCLPFKARAEVPAGWEIFELRCLEGLVKYRDVVAVVPRKTGEECSTETFGRPGGIAEGIVELFDGRNREAEWV